LISLDSLDVSRGSIQLRDHSPERRLQWVYSGVGERLIPSHLGESSTSQMGVDTLGAGEARGLNSVSATVMLPPAESDASSVPPKS
jgi:hypothetical protein